MVVRGVGGARSEAFRRCLGPHVLLPAFVAHHAACMSYACVRGEADAFHKGLGALERSFTAGAA